MSLDILHALISSLHCDGVLAALFKFGRRVSENTHLKAEDGKIWGHKHFNGIHGQCLQITESLEVSDKLYCYLLNIRP